LARLLDEGQAIFGTDVPLSLDFEAVANNQTSTLPGMEDLAAEHVSLIMKHQPTGGYLLAGHSFGGLLAFEIAHQLQRAGKRVEAVFLLDAWSKPWKRWPDFKLGSKSDIRNTFKNGLGYLVTKSIRRLQFESRKLGLALKHSPPPPKSDDLSDRVSWKLQVKIYRNAVRGYRPRRLESRGVLFRAKEPGPHPYVTDYSFGWAGLFTRGLEIVDVPGTHHTLIQEPHIRTLARHFSAALERNG
jgi:thioesterase domain-containing protein